MNAVDEHAVTATKLSEPYDVVVIGGGISGLVVTYRLNQRGLRVLLLEARDALGGRCGGRADEWGIEAGAEFVHGEAASTWELLREFNLVAHRHPQPGMAARLYYVNGELIEGTQEIGRLVDSICRHIESFNPEVARPTHVAQFLASLDPAILDAEFASSDPEFVALAKCFARDRIERFEGSPLEDLGSLEYALQMALSTGGSNNYRIVGGYRALVDALSEVLSQSETVDIHLSEAVTRIEATSEATSKVRTATGQSFSASKVVITVPLPILHTIAPLGSDGPATHSGQVGALSLIPPMDQEWVQALDGLGVGHALKVVVAIRDLDMEPFGFLHTLESMPTWINIPQDDSDISLLLGYFGGSTAVELAAKPDGELRLMAREILGRVLRVGESQFCDPVVVHRWDEVEAIYGTYSYPRQGGQRSAQTLARPRGNIFFAGEALSLNGHIGTVHGAIDTAERCVAQVVDALER